MQRLWGAAILFASACGDDGAASAKGGDEPMQGALETEGVRADLARAHTIYRALCALYAQCRGPDDSCFSNLAAKWDAIVASERTDECLDAFLDSDVCRLGDGCGEHTACQPFFDRSVALCDQSP